MSGASWASQRKHPIAVGFHFVQIEEEDPSSKRCHKDNSFLLFKRLLGDGELEPAGGLPPRNSVAVV